MSWKVLSGMRLIGGKTKSRGYKKVRGGQWGEITLAMKMWKEEEEGGN